MVKRAAIYLRTSTERQAEKVSPQEQEAACRKLAERLGYAVGMVYRDIERYRVRGRMVEPGGSRADRPALRQMLADGKAGNFDVILAWKEDRLYRGYRPMLDVLELVEENKIGIDLVMETFDPKMAPIKAWAAKMELDNIKERVAMGKTGRLKAGKTIGGALILGYDFVAGLPVLNEAEAAIVRFIFHLVAWGDTEYPGGVPVKEVRRRLIERDYQQKTKVPKAKPWARGVIYAILGCETYLGKMNVHFNGEVYPVDFPPIIDQATFDKAHENMRSRQRYRVRNARELGFLLVGKVYGPCKHRLDYRVNRYRYERQPDGSNKRFDRPAALAYGMCSVSHDDGPCEFRGAVRLGQVEQAVWDKVWPFLLDVQNIRRVSEAKISAWGDDREIYQAEVERLEKTLDGLDEQRRWVIVQGRKHVLTDKDMAEQLALIEREAADIRRDLAAARQALKASTDLRAMVAELTTFLETYQGELIELGGVPIHDMTPEQKAKVRRWFDAVVVRVDLGEDGNSLKVQTDPFGALRVVTDWSSLSRRR